MGIETAIIGSAILGAGASAITSTKAANKAADSSQYATDQTIAFNNKALDLQQQNTQPYRDAGALATQKLLEQLGLAPAKTTAATTPQPGSPDYAAYTAAHPDVKAAWDSTASKNEKYGGDYNKWVEDQYNTWGKDAGWEMPTVAAKPADTPQVAQAPTGAVAPDAVRPAIKQTEGYTGPEFVSAGRYQMPEMDPLDVSLANYQKDPGYDWQQSEAARATLAGSAATGALRSGAAAKALQDRAQQIANTDYSNWRSYTTGQYNTDRARLDQNAQFGFNALLSQNQQQNALNTANSQFGYNALTNQNNLNNQFNQQNFSTDRAFTADQKQQGVNNLFSLTGVGASAAGSANNAIGQNASNNSNALFSNASAQGNAALASAGQVNNAINTGTNALAYYLGNKKVA